jgi:transcriptional regulator with XRE-family HTH domain
VQAAILASCSGDQHRGSRRRPKRLNMVAAPLAPLIERLISELGLSQAEFAEALDASERSVARWKVGGSYPQYEARARLEEMTALADRLQRSFPDAAAGAAWLRAPSAYFGGSAPLEAFLRGRFAAVEAALDAFDAGRAK